MNGILPKKKLNVEKHGVSFLQAILAFLDERHVIIEDSRHSRDEQRYVCLGMVAGRVMTVRFTYRNEQVRIFGAAYWRKGQKEYVARQRI